MLSRKPKNSILSLTIISGLFFVLFVSFSTNAAEIRGTVTNSATGQPITDATIYIFVGSGNKCDNYSVTSAMVDPNNGSYTANVSSSGTYYLQAHIFTGPYFDEWWANTASATNCNGAESIVVAASDSIVTGKDFQLGQGASISGTVFSSDTGAPVSGVEIFVHIYTGDPCNPTSVPEATQRNINETDGTYTLDPLHPGTYYLQTSVLDSSLVDEWWDTPYSRFDCSRASDIFVEEGDNITGKDFQLLDRAPEAGNINMDESVDLADAILALQGLTMQPSERIWLEGDANLDDEIGLAEILYILQQLSAPAP